MKEALNLLYGARTGIMMCAKDRKKAAQNIKEITQAIRVLEAAGKVHKNDAIMAFGNAIGYLDDMINLDERGEEDVRAVFALLEALPEEEK